ncbi:MAG: hypothetical protein JW778_05030 [Candidatus Altiarchaeota archaeon]|nr:hypothetical protein [Candidatus Altiarchaeota archaeon]
MTEVECYENYPVCIPALSTVQTLMIYGIGAYVFSRYSQIMLALYLLYIIWIELRVLEKSCRNCVYYGKLCGLGRGKICALILKKGNQKFAEKKITWKDLVPDFLAFLLPLLAGIPLLLQNWDWILAGLMVTLLLLATAGNGIIRGRVCKHCKQRRLGCPAEQMFQRKSTTIP